MRTQREALIARMKGEHWSRVNVRGISPYTIDRVAGVASKRPPVVCGSLCEWTVDVHAYDVRCPDGTTRRFALLKDAKRFIHEHMLHRAGIVKGT